MKIPVSNDAVTLVHKRLTKALPKRFNSDGSAFPYIHQHHLPDRWNPNLGVAVVVADDAPQVRETGHDRVLVRITVHSPTFDTSRKWGRNIYDFLTSPFGGLGLGVSKSRSTGVVVAPDSLAGGYVSTMSISVGMSKFFQSFE